jgi:PAS domain S-box-containing protein
MTVSNSNQALTQFLTTLCEIMKVEKACFLEFDKQQGLLSGSAYVGIENVELIARLGEGMAGWVAEQGVCMVINDIQHTPELSDGLAEALAESSFLATPLYFEKKLLGVIVLAGKRDGASFDFKDRQLLVTFIPLAAWIIYKFVSTPAEQESAQQLKDQIELLQAEKEELAHYIRCLTEVINCALLVVDLEGQITHVNPIGEKMFNLPASRLEGEPLSRILGAQTQQLVLDSAEKPGGVDKEIKFTDSKGKQMAGHLSCCPYQDSQQRKQGFLVAIHELGESKESAEQDRLNSIRELTGGIAHEIRNPLAGIMTTAETLKETFDPQDHRKEYLERIINEIHRMNQFLTRFFAFARPQKPQKQSCSLPQIIDRILDLEAQNISRQNISVTKDYQPSLPNIKLDAHQIQQVFLNLIINSLQAMPNGGELKISIATNGGTGEQAPKYIRVNISDTGVGIRPQDLNKIFSPFYTTKPKGVGLGLSVSQQILKEHKGKAGVESVLGEGTTFSISLPVEN